MSSNVLTSRLPWQDRWTQPTLAQLLEPLKIQHRRLFEQLMEDLQSFEQVDQVIHWYGSAWNWTIQYRLHDPNAAEPHTLLYLVPRVETPIIVIPLSDGMIEQLPMKRLNRFIRDGIKNAKCAVAIHWATWTPNSKAEVTFLTDLLKRKCKLILGAAGKDKEPQVGDDEQAENASPAVATTKAGKAPKGKTSAGKATAGQAAAPARTVAVVASTEKKTPATKTSASKTASGQKKANSKAAAKPAAPSASKSGGKTGSKPSGKSTAAGSKKKDAKAGSPKAGSKVVKKVTKKAGKPASRKPAAAASRKPAGKPASKPARKPGRGASTQAKSARGSARAARPVAQVSKSSKKRSTKRAGKVMAASGGRKK